MKCLKRIEELHVGVIALMGANGSGKGTLAHLLHLLLSMTDAKVAVITVSKLIQALLDEPEPTELGNRLRANRARLLQTAKHGVITRNYDDDIMIEMMDLALCEALDGGATILILDGFFRTVPQRRIFAACKTLFLIHIMAEEKDALANAAKRTLDRAHLNPPLPPRPDDAEWAVKERYAIYKTDTRSALDEHARLRGRPIIRMGSQRRLTNKGIKSLEGLGLPRSVFDHLVDAFQNPNSAVAKFVKEIEHPRSTAIQQVALPRQQTERALAA
jgi:adenylate kinase family enzyme